MQTHVCKPSSERLLIREDDTGRFLGHLSASMSMIACLFDLDLTLLQVDLRSVQAYSCV